MDDFNPWDVDSLEAFACLKCPECDFDAKFEGPFQNHAVENHPLSDVFFGLKTKIKQLKKEEVENCVESSLIKTELDDVEINSKEMQYDQTELETDQIDFESKEFDLEENGSNMNLDIQADFRFQVHDGKKYWCCNMCDYRTNRTHSLRNHIYNVHKQEFSCIICGEIYTEPENLSQHIWSAHENQEKTKKNPEDPFNVNQIREYSCDQCTVSFSKKSDLKSHKASVHEGNKPHMCSMCGHSFGDNCQLQLHISGFHEKKKHWKCSSCGYKSTLKGGMKSHIKRRHEGENIEIIFIGEKKYKCNNCDFSTETRCNLTKHVKEVHDGYLYCAFCHHSFSNRSNLNSHVRQVHEGKKRKFRHVNSQSNQNDNNETEQEYPVYDNQCVISGQCYETVDDLKLHKYTVHDENKPTIKNESHFSHFLVNNKLESESHKFEEETTLETLETENDSFKTSYEDAYDEEKVPNINNQFGKYYFCDQCDAKFYKKHELDSHKSLVHIENKPHMCPICGLSFNSNHRLKLHKESVHEKKKPYKCSSCGYRSSLKGSMTKHIDKVHEGANIKIIYLGDNPYKCVNCDFSTAMKSNLTKHVDEVHDGNWCCELCDSTFTNRSNLNSHVRQVHEGKKRKKKSQICKPQEKSVKVDDGKSNVVCDYCGSDFSNQSNLYAHIRQVHEGKKRLKRKSVISPHQENLIDEDQEENCIDDFDNTDNFESEYDSNLPISNVQESSDHEVRYAHKKSSVHDGKKLLAQVQKHSNKPKISKAPITPFLFGGINHVKPIELTKIEKD